MTVRRWWRHAAFDKRLRMFLSMVIAFTSAAVLLASTLSAITSITDKSRELLMMQVRENAQSISTKLSDYYDTTVAIMLVEEVQSYLKNPASTLSAYARQTDAVRNSLVNFYNMRSGINFIALVRSWPGGYVFKGGNSSLFDERYQEDLDASVATGVGALRISIGSAYSTGGKQTLSIYSPVFSTHRINRTLGMLCLSIDEELLFSAEQRGGDVLFDGMLYSLADDRVLTTTGGDVMDRLDYRDQLAGDSGSFYGDGQLYVYHRVSGSHFYIIGATPLSSLYRDSVQTMALLTILIVAMACVSIVISNYLVKRMYQSLNQLKSGMEVVAGGDLSVRLKAEEEGEDFATIFAGFNVMTSDIQRLMERVKAEERQAEQIRYSALQAQIHPHFLYNTLDCIRWMAAADGNPELVRLVKALAQFYRICLSRGKDVISVEQELLFTSSYMTIQNIRYGGKVHYQQDVPFDFFQLRIPKITIQPLVENCVQHGFVDKDAPFTVRVSGLCMPDCAVLMVEDDGAGMTDKELDALNRSLETDGEEIGYGVRNVHRRIRLLFGEGYGLSYERGERGGVCVKIHLPKEEEDV